MSGIFVTFEGIEGSGKSTQAKLFLEWLKSKNKEVVLLREPGSTKIGESIRDILLFSDPDEISGSAELFLFLAARTQIVHEKIKPALDKGIIVVLDRYSDSTLAYQGYADNIPIDIIESMNSFATFNIKPDVTFILDVAVEEGLRKSGCKDRIEKKGLDYHARVRDGYYNLAERFPHRICLIKVKDNYLDTQQEIRDIFRSRFL